MLDVKETQNHLEYGVVGCEIGTQDIARLRVTESVLDQMKSTTTAVVENGESPDKQEEQQL